MATPVNSTITLLSLRLRDTGSIAYPRSTILSVLKLTQRIVMAHLKLNVTEVTFTPVSPGFTNLPNAVCNLIVNGIVDCMSVESVIQDGRPLDRVPWRDLVHQDPEWMSKIGTQFDTFATVGKGLILFLIPVLKLPTPITMTYIAVPPDPTDTAVSLTIPDVAVPLLRDITETVLLTTSRRFDAAGDPTLRIQNLIETFKAHRQLLDIQGQA
jgi:hypothetical protein